MTIPNDNERWDGMWLTTEDDTDSAGSDEYIRDTFWVLE
jgi:hypothetical protein